MTNKEYPNFDCRRFEDDVFQNNTPDPFHTRMRNIRTWRDVREYFGISPMHCDEHLLREGVMSAKLHEALENKLGAERLAGYFSDGSQPKKSKEQQEQDDLVTMMFGSVAEYNRLRLHRLGKGNKT